MFLQESDEDDYDEDEEAALEEKGQDWDEMEREVHISSSLFIPPPLINTIISS